MKPPKPVKIQIILHLSMTIFQRIEETPHANVSNTEKIKTSLNRQKCINKLSNNIRKQLVTKPVLCMPTAYDRSR